MSYASQDADAARRICDALRAMSVEVWFDQSALRGGDAWDASIRRQIKDCALFMPIISANTQARLEGYFRREWNLAASRTLDMADDQAFLLPVVIDMTLDASARVPEKFRDVQWTHLPTGTPSTAFVEHVHRLLSGGAAQNAHRAIPCDACNRARRCGCAAGSAIDCGSAVREHESQRGGRVFRRWSRRGAAERAGEDSRIAGGGTDVVLPVQGQE